MINIEKLIDAMTSKGYEVFQDDSKPFNLNIVGIRNADRTPNIYNDHLIVFWKYDGEWNVVCFKCTTEAGLYYLKHPLNNKGTALVKPGQYRGVWELGKHQGKYQALCQKKPITVIRDYDKDGEFDYDSGREETGVFGINCHRSNAEVESVLVDRWSAGCQVLANPDEFKVLMAMCERSSHHWGNSFTYTLLDEQQL